MSNRSSACRSAHMLVAKAKKRVARQKAIVARLFDTGQQTTLATEILHEYERSLVLYEMRLSQSLKQ